MALIEAQNISVDHRLHAASFTLQRGEVLGLIGPNGAGKSTLLNALVGLEEMSGRLVLSDVDVSELSDEDRAKILGLMPQAMQSAWSLSVLDVVSLGRIPWRDNNAEAVQQAMRMAQIQAFAQRKVDELSGGERARVWLARVLAGQPKVLLADEPIASLDIHYQLSVMNVLKQYAQDGHGVMVALHDLSLAARYCDRLCLLHQGKVVELGVPTQVCTAQRLSEVYGVAVEVDFQRHPPVILPK